MTVPEPQEVARGTHLFLEHLERLVDENPEISDVHDAFEVFCMNKYSIGDAATSIRTGGKNDRGIDFYSSNGRTYHVAQCKIPERDWLESHPEKMKLFGPAAVSDCRSALSFLLGTAKAQANEQVRYLFAQIEGDKDREDFVLVFFLLVFGRLNNRAQGELAELRTSYDGTKVRLVLQQMDDLVDDFLVGSAHTADKVEIRLRRDKEQSLNAHDYCYFLANAADVFTAFKNYGWRLFDLNLRYEVRNSSVNGDIVNSLTHDRTRRNFHHYNNGLIIVCQHYDMHGDCVRVSNAQVINGLQTVKSIYNAVTTKEVALSDLDKDCRVQVKVIQNDKADFVAGVVQATNNQNPMAPRNLKSNAREQKVLRLEFSLIDPRWFFQVKQGEWESLTQEAGRFFKVVVGFPVPDFRPDPNRKRGRVLDNQDAAKAWLAFLGFSDWAGDRTTHYFAKEEVYDVAFRRHPTGDHWHSFRQTTDFREARTIDLAVGQATAYEYLLAYMIWEFVRHYIPSPRQYREEALQEGVLEGKIRKADGSFISSLTDQENYLAENDTYQTWRLMANMKEILVEAVSFILVNKYSEIDEAKSRILLMDFDARDFLRSGEVKDTASSAFAAPDLASDFIFSRIMGFLHYVAGQYWEDKRNQVLSTSRIRTLLLRADMVSDFKKKILELNKRVALDKPWKPGGTSFLDSLPSL